jgi:hypothetical protein
MDMEHSNRIKLVESVENAWKDVPYPGDENIFTPLSYDDEGITEYFKGTTWKNHKIADLRAHDVAISVFFTPEAYHYWLATYLIAAIEDPDELSQGMDSLIYSFIPTDEDWFKEEQFARMDLLTNNQKKVIIDVIEYLAERYYNPSFPEEIEEMKSALEYLYEITNFS